MRSGAGTGEENPEPVKNEPAPQHCPSFDEDELLILDKLVCPRPTHGYPRPVDIVMFNMVLDIHVVRICRKFSTS